MLLANELNAQPVGGAPQLWFNPSDNLEFRGIGATPIFRNCSKIYRHGRPACPESMCCNFAKLTSNASRRVLEILQLSESPPYRYRRRNDSDAGRKLRPGVEGIMDRTGIDFYPTIKAAGIDIDYVLMDEPLYFGHDYTRKDACRLPIVDVGRGVAESVSTIRSYHPKAKFVLREPTSGAYLAQIHLQKFGLSVPAFAGRMACPLECRASPHRTAKYFVLI